MPSRSASAPDVEGPLMRMKRLARERVAAHKARALALSEVAPPPLEVVRDRHGNRMCPDNPKKRSLYCIHCGGKPQVHRMCDEHKDQRASHCGPCGKRKCPCNSGAQKAKCVPCKGASICKCGRRRHECKTCDPQGHLAHLLRNRLRDARKARGDTKTQRTMEVVGCTPAFLYDKLGELCDFYNATNKYPGFVFDKKEINYEIDHFLPLIPPVRLAKEEFTRRGHWTNCRPMPEKGNTSKGNRIEEGPNPDDEREMIRKRASV